MPVTLNQDGSLSLLRLKGAIDIGCAAELKRLLLEAFKSGGEVCVSAEGATDLDSTAVQLLWAAEREAKGAGVKFSLTGLASEQISAALGEAGLKQFLIPVDAE